jgi:hypothetical protein
MKLDSNFQNSAGYGNQEFCLLFLRIKQQILSVSNTTEYVMQVSIPVFKQRKFAVAMQPDFFIHLSLLGGFLGLVGYLAIVCHHVH